MNTAAAGLLALAISMTGPAPAGPPHPDTHPGKVGHAGEPEWIQRAWHSEVVYRNRVDRLKALRDQAEARGQTEKVAQVDALFERLEDKYEKHNEHLREVAGGQHRAQLETKLAEWRREHREHLHERWLERRAERRERRTDRREDRQDNRADRREDRAERHEEWRDHRLDRRAAMRERWAGHADQASGRAESRRDARDERREIMSDARADRHEGWRDHARAHADDVAAEEREDRLRGAARRQFLDKRPATGRAAPKPGPRSDIDAELEELRQEIESD